MQRRIYLMSFSCTDAPFDFLSLSKAQDLVGLKVEYLRSYVVRYIIFIIAIYSKRFPSNFPPDSI